MGALAWIVIATSVYIFRDQPRTLAFCFRACIVRHQAAVGRVGRLTLP